MQARSELCQAIANEVLREFARTGAVIKPPVPVEDLAGWLGYQIVPLYFVPDEFSALVSTKDQLIGVNGRHHRHRQRFSLCHELAHILLKHPPESRCTAKQITLYNIEADECASELLIPTELLVQRLKSTPHPAELARAFDVSEEAMRRKLAALAELTVSITKTSHDQPTRK